jgi:phage shock protein C
LQTQQRLSRSRYDRMIGGVCGGLGHYFGLDPVIVRLIFVVLAITTFLTPILYPILWLVMPEGDSAAPVPPPDLPPDARFDPMTGRPLAEPRTPAGYGTASDSGAGGMSRAGGNRMLGFVLAGIGGIILLSQVGDALETVFNVDLGGVIFPLVLVGIGIFLLRRRTT